MRADELRRALHDIPDDYEIRMVVKQHIRHRLDDGHRTATSNLQSVDVSDNNYKKVWLRGTEER